MPPYLSCPLGYYQKLGISWGGSWCFQCPSWSFSFPSYQQGDPEQPTSLTVSSWLPVSPVCSPCYSHSLYLSFWVGLSVSSLFTCTHFSLFSHTPLSVLWGHPGFETMDFLVRYPGSNSVINPVTCVVYCWEVTLSELPFVICKIEILLLPLIVLVQLLNQIIHENYFEICWSIICAQDMLVITSAHTFNLSVSIFSTCS